MKADAPVRKLVKEAMRQQTYMTRFSVVEALQWPVRRSTLSRVLVAMARNEDGCPHRVRFAKVSVDGDEFVVTVVGHDREQTRYAELN